MTLCDFPETPYGSKVDYSPTPSGCFVLFLERQHNLGAHPKVGPLRKDGPQYVLQVPFQWSPEPRDLISVLPPPFLNNKRFIAVGGSPERMVPFVVQVSSRITGPVLLIFVDSQLKMNSDDN